MGVPAHDERDFAFAKKYSLPIKQVVDAKGMNFSTDAWGESYAIKGEGVAIQSGKYDGLNFKACVDAVATDLAAQHLGEKKTTWRLRDWGISRQRYWGTPIPIVHCPEHGAQPVPLSQLPVRLPEDCIPDGSGNPLHKHEGFHQGATCPICGQDARRETDTMDTFVDSSWYFIRYCLPEQDQKDSVVMTNDAVDYWMPGKQSPSGRSGGMDQYIGGIEHAILHLLYARFWTKVMRDLDLMRTDEPFSNLLCQGMVLNHIYYWRGEKGEKNYIPPEEVTQILDAQGRISGGKDRTGRLLEYGGVGKMGKTERNGVDPQDLINKYGADTARLYTMFTAPPEATLEWNDAAVEGSYRFLRRVWQLGSKLETIKIIAPKSVSTGARGQVDPQKLSKNAKALRLEIHSILRQVSFDYERMQYNTVVSGAMKLLNALEDFKGDEGTQVAANSDMATLFEGYGILLRVLYPAAPHLSHALWQALGYEEVLGDLLDATWPQVDEAALQKDELELMLQVGGKLRGSVLVPASATKEQIEAAALASEAFIKAAAGAAPKKIIVVPGRLVNIVV
jgi:leucyl-tRNA synthetase